ncbi:MAG TPA: YqiA/YcfP family alpha/beta fold hydrolase [Burkholderiaceae bacterium]|jgi:predicted esterase YcpF (UPF0227 family)|nr:YqiA/YcfP family alpha/beta fold hydrolase [Burkholderiaceae bacterium]
MTARPPVSHLLYLHGFRSSPQSFKARRIAAWLAAHRPAVHWHCPQLPPSPRGALRDVLAHVEAWPRETTGIVGSSLGGFYAMAVAERLGPACRAVLLNPAVNPARDLAGHIGELQAWHSDERFEFRADDVDALRDLTPAALTHPERYLAVIAKGDEVLDWRETTARVEPARVKLLEAGDHALSDFDDHLPDILDFLGLAHDDLRMQI